MPKTCTPRSRRRLPILGTLTLAATVALAGCTSTPEWAGSRMTGAGPATLSPEQTYDTLMKVADSTRAGGDLSNAVALYRRAHELAPQSVQPLQHMGDTLAQMQSYTDAVQAYQEALRIAPNNPDLERGLGSVLLGMGQPQLALTYLQAAYATNPQDPRTLNALGVANDLAGHHDVAIENYRKGLAVAPDQLSLRNNLGLSEALAGDYKSAIATLSDLAARPGATPRNRQNLALVYGLAGDNDHAAQVARADLDETAIRNNINYYTLLRSLDDVGRTAAILGADVRATRAAQPTATVSDPAISQAPDPEPQTPVAMRPIPTPNAGTTASGTAPAGGAQPDLVIRPGPTTALQPPPAAAPAAASAPTAAPSTGTAEKPSGGVSQNSTSALEVARVEGKRTTPSAKPEVATPISSEPPVAATPESQPAASSTGPTTASKEPSSTETASAAPPPADPKHIVVEVARFQTETMADKVSAALTAKGVEGLKVVRDRDLAGNDIYAIRTGDFPSEEAAQAEVQRLRATGAFESKVVHVAALIEAPGAVSDGAHHD